MCVPCRFRVSLQIVFVLGVVVALSAQAWGADYTVHVVEPAITNHLILEDGLLPPVCKEIKTMKLWASRGEVGDHYEMGRP